VFIINVHRLEFLHYRNNGEFTPVCKDELDYQPPHLVSQEANINIDFPSSFLSSASSIKNSSWEGNGGESGGEKSSTTHCKLPFISASILLAMSNLNGSIISRRMKSSPALQFFFFRSRFIRIHVKIRKKKTISTFVS